MSGLPSTPGRNTCRHIACCGTERRCPPPCKTLDRPNRSKADPLRYTPGAFQFAFSPCARDPSLFFHTDSRPMISLTDISDDATSRMDTA